MKRRQTLSFLLMILIFFSVSVSYADDTDLYMSSGEGVEANLLIIFDNSGSMNDEVQAYFYDTAITYDPLVVPQGNRDTVYYRTRFGRWILFKGSIAEVPCSTARSALTNLGHYEGATNSTCTSQMYSLRTGNYRNYLSSIGGDEYLPKLTIAKRVINDFLNSVQGVRIGVMVFNRVVTIDGVSETEGGRLQSSIKSLTDSNRSQLIADVNNIVAQTWTPLAETLYEAGLYFKGGNSYFNPGVVYISPIQYYCQRNYVILITDGESTRDRNSILATAIGDRDNDGREPGYINDSLGTDYLDDVAKYLYETDLSPSMQGQQNINTYTIGFTISSNLLERTAAHGHGKYFYSSNAQSLADAFQNIIDDILRTNTSFVAPIVPISRMERTSAGDKIYLGFFKPVKDGMWSGNIKKFGVAQTNNPAAGIVAGDILDVTGSKALDSSGKFLQTARSYWTDGSTLDGGEVERGGLGEVLMNRTSARNIYTYLGMSNDLTNGSNAVTTANTLITPAVLGLSVSDTDGRDKLINFVHGLDAYDDNGNTDRSEKRDWILGAFLHSRPLIVHYGTNQSVIYAGANDGMLHAFDDATGEELWAFIPPNLLNRLQALHQDVIETFVDGSPKVYMDDDKKILLFGERRGGDRYVALDITSPALPKFLWEIGPSTTGFEELGQTWSTPQVGKIRFGSGEKWVAFIGGGYDDNQDNDPATVPDTKGRAIYAFDILTGSLLWRYSHAENATMAYSIPGDVTRVDTDGDGRIDRLYVGDMGGQVWRFDIGGSDPAGWSGKVLFKSNATSADGRKIFYPVDVTLENDGLYYEMIFFGTGDREHPKEMTKINRLYALKDKNPSSPLTESDLVDVTLDLLQDPNTSQTEKNEILTQLKNRSGWYIKLDLHTGEKCLAPPVVYYKTVYFTTFTPTAGTETDPCFVGEGTARMYVLKQHTGNAAFNLDVTNDMGGIVVRRSDRSGVIGTAIPSGAIITFIGGTAVAYTGVGGGVHTPTLPSTRSLVPINWRFVY